MSRILFEHLGLKPPTTTIFDSEVVWQIEDYEQEYAAVRAGAALLDRSGEGPVRVSGSGAVDVLNAALTRDVEFLAPERAQSAMLLTAEGMPIEVVTVISVNDDDFFVHTGPGTAGRVVAALRAAAPGSDVEIENLSDTMSILSVEGPSAWRAINSVLGADYVSLAYESTLPAEVDGVEVLVARIGVTGEYGYALFAPNAVAVELWKALAAHATPIGYRAVETAMLEVRQPLLHRELQEQDTVVGAGLNWLVELSKEEFVGREAMVEQWRAGNGTRPIGFSVAEGLVAAGEELYVDGELVGTVQHVVGSPGLGGQLGLARVQRQWQAARLEFTTVSGAVVRTIAAPYVVPGSWTTPIEV